MQGSVGGVFEPCNDMAEVVQTGLICCASHLVQIKGLVYLLKVHQFCRDIVTKAMHTYNQIILKGQINEPKCLFFSPSPMALNVAFISPSEYIRTIKLCLRW